MNYTKIFLILLSGFAFSLEASSEMQYIDQRFNIVDYSKSPAYQQYLLNQSAWFNAIAKNDLEQMVKLASKVGIDGVCRDPKISRLFGHTALTYVATYGNESMTHLLLNISNINVNAKSKRGFHALEYAARNGHENIARMLLSCPSIEMAGLLAKAAKHPHPNIVNLVLQALPEKFKTEEAEMALWSASEKGQDNVIKEVLLRVPGIDINAGSPNGSTPLILAAQHGHASVVKLLLSLADTNINAQNNNGLTAFIAAANAGQENIVRLLLQEPHINVNIQNNSGNTALMRATIKGHERIVALLLRAPKIKVYTINEFGKSVADYAHRNRRLEQLFIERDKFVKELIITCFDAIKKHDLETVKKITYQLGIDEIIDINGETLLDKACASNCPKIIEYLLQNAKNPRKLLTRFPFELISPSSEVFESLIYLAYGQMHPSKQEMPSSAKDVAKLEQTAPKAICANCASTENLGRCGRCKTVYYCSDACQKTHWLKHKRDCKKPS